jgi:hypothetical protein
VASLPRRVRLRLSGVRRGPLSVSSAGTFRGVESFGRAERALASQAGKAAIAGGCTSCGTFEARTRATSPPARAARDGSPSRFWNCSDTTSAFARLIEPDPRGVTWPVVNVIRRPIDRADARVWIDLWNRRLQQESARPGGRSPDPSTPYRQGPSVSPCARCAGTAFSETAIVTNGFVSDPV